MFFSQDLTQVADFPTEITMFLRHLSQAIIVFNFKKNLRSIQFQGKLTIQTQENVETPHFGPDLGPLGPNLGRHIFFYKTSS